MYVRPQGDRGVKVPENYSGHAFRDQSPYGDMPPPAHVPTSPTVKRERVSAPPPPPPPPPIFEPRQAETEADDYAAEELEGEYAESPKSGEEQRTPSIFSSLLPTTASASSHFPFGHGIGSEELLILAIMLLVFLSEESDQELLLLLGFLLFAG